MQSIQEVAPGLFMITQSIHYRQFKSSVNVYVIGGKNGLVFDSGYGSRQKRRHLVHSLGQILSLEKSRQGSWAFTRAMTSHGHWDHFSGLGHLQEVLGLKILATQKQAEKIGSKKIFKASFQEENRFLNPANPRFVRACRHIWDSLSNELFMQLARVRFVEGPIDIIGENTSLSVNGESWQVIPVPGHCDDDLVLYNRERGVLLGGDIVLRSITTWLGPPKSNLTVYQESLERLMKLPNLKLILPAHGSPIPNPGKRIQAIIDHREKRTRDIFQLVVRSGEKGLSYGEIFHAIYPKTTFFKRSLQGGWIRVTLQHLFDGGQIVRRPRGRRIIFLPSN